MKTFYRILQAIVIVTLVIVLGFFVIGLGEGTVDGANMILWLIMIAVPAGALFASSQLWANQKRGLACVLLAIPAAPGLFFGLFVALFVILQPDMR